MFLLTIRHNCRNFLVQDVFQRSGETVSQHFYTVLRALVAFAKEKIKSPSFDETLSEILKIWSTTDGLKIVSVLLTEHTSPSLFQQRNLFCIGQA